MVVLQVPDNIPELVSSLNDIEAVVSIRVLGDGVAEADKFHTKQ